MTIHDYLALPLIPCVCVFVYLCMCFLGLERLSIYYKIEAGNSFLSHVCRLIESH